MIDPLGEIGLSLSLAQYLATGAAIESCVGRSFAVGEQGYVATRSWLDERGDAWAVFDLGPRGTWHVQANALWREAS